MARVLRMPGVSHDAAPEGVLSSWRIAEWDRFEAAETIAYVETSTLLLSVEAGRPGVLVKMLVEPGSRVAVGMPIGVIADCDEPVPDLEALLAELGVGDHAEPEPPAPRHASQATWTDAARPTFEQLRTRVRAERLDRLLTRSGSAGYPVTIEHLVIRAVAAAHRVLPALNLTRGPDGVGGPEETVDVAVALSAPDGHVVPVLRDVALLSLQDIALLVGDLAAEARAGRLHLDDRGGSISVSHLGRYGLDEAVPHVVSPQVAALAVGSLREQPVVEGGAVVAGTVLTLTLTIDHDAVDDVTATRWLGVVAALLERPEWMLD